MHDDFLVDCLNEDFQQLALRPCKESLWKKELNDSALDQIQAILQFGKTNIGMNLSLQEIDNLLDDGVVAPVGMGAQVQTQTPKKVAPKITKVTGRRKIQLDDDYFLSI